jgi:hypothetical protein
LELALISHDEVASPEEARGNLQPLVDGGRTLQNATSLPMKFACWFCCPALRRYLNSLMEAFYMGLRGFKHARVILSSSDVMP